MKLMRYLGHPIPGEIRVFGDSFSDVAAGVVFERIISRL